MNENIKYEEIRETLLTNLKEYYDNKFNFELKKKNDKYINKYFKDIINDEEVMILILTNDINFFHTFEYRIKDTIFSKKDVIIKIISNNAYYWNYIPENIKKEIIDDQKLILKLCDTHSLFSKYVKDKNDEFKNKLLFSSPRDLVNYINLDNEEEVFNYILKNPYLLNFLPSKYNNSKKFAKKCIENNPECYKFFKSNVTKDINLTLLAIEKDINNFSYIHYSLNKNEDIIKLVLEKNSDYFKYINYDLRSKQGICLSVLKDNPSNISYVTPSLKRNANFIKKAIDINPEVYKYVYDEIKDNKELLDYACSKDKNYEVYRKNIVEEEIPIKQTTMTNEEKEKLITLIREYTNNENYTPIMLSNYVPTIFDKLKDKQQVKKILIKNEFGILGNLLYRNMDNLDDDILTEIYVSDIKHNKDAKSLIPEEHIKEKIFNTKEIIKDMVSYDGMLLQYFKVKFKKDREIILEAVKNNWHITKYLDKEFINDKEIILQALNSNNKYKDIYIGEDLLKDYDIAYNIATKNKKLFKKLSIELQNNEELLKLYKSKEVK